MNISRYKEEQGFCDTVLQKPFCMSAVSMRNDDDDLIYVV